MTNEDEFLQAWDLFERIDTCKAKIEKFERLERIATTASDAIAAEQKLATLHQELASLNRQAHGGEPDIEEAATATTLVSAPAAAPAQQSVTVQAIYMTAPASSPEPGPAQAATQVVEQAPPSAPAEPAEPAQAAPVGEQATSPQQVPVEPAVVPSEAERPEARQDRRLSRLRELGGNYICRGSWMTDPNGRRGALADLIKEEQAAGRPMSDKSDVRQDLQAAAEREREGKPPSH